jgi:hypothetical protein
MDSLDSETKTTASNGALAELQTALRRDLRAAAKDLSLPEIRYMVDLYYEIQEHRKATGNQSRQLAEGDEPVASLVTIHGYVVGIEEAIKAALDAWTKQDDLASWARGHKGVGPVIAAGLAAHIDVERARTAGAVWRFAGLDPTSKWKKGEKRPWNARLKVLCWKLGDSFVKQSGREDAFYGQYYRQKKAEEVARDLRDENAEKAAQTLKERNITDKPTRKVYESGHFPAGRLDLRARRKAVKLFLAHYLQHGRELKGLEVVAPYPIAHLGHAHEIKAPEVDND